MQKNGSFINDKKNGVFKYLSFANGGGMIKLNGKQLKEGKAVYLNRGECIDINLDFDRWEITVGNPKMGPLKMKL